jgi:hypothetical protein
MCINSMVLISTSKLNRKVFLAKFMTLLVIDFHYQTKQAMLNTYTQ